MRSTAGQWVLLAAMTAVFSGCPTPPTRTDPPDAGTWTGPADSGTGQQPGPDGGGDDPDAGDDGHDGGTDGGVGEDGGEPAEPVVDLRADVNRNGVVELTEATEDLDEETWSKTHGAVLLANIDDDQSSCPYSGTLTDVQLPRCHDAADEVINGDDDLLDLSFLKTVPWPDAPPDALGTLTVSAPATPMVRLFRRTAAGYEPYTLGAPLEAAALREGLDVAIEAKDIVRNSTVWDGTVDVTFTVEAGDDTRTDTVRLRVAPVLTFHHLEPAERVFVANVPNDADSKLFQNALEQANTAAGVTAPVYKIGTQDQWAQDYFETGYMSKPAPGGAQHVIRVNYRSANVYSPNSKSNPLRRAGRVVYLLRGKDSAAIQQYDAKTPQDMQSLNSFGNFETIPPYSHGGNDYPLGRVYRGSVPSFFVDRSFEAMIASQAVQPPVYVDTSWLLVGHVDETISFLKVNSPRGWIVLANDVPLARQMLQQEQANGNGQVKMFTGQSWLGGFGFETPAETTIDDVLADTDVMNESAASAAEVDAQIAILKAETGITDAEIVKVPFLHQPVDGYSLAYQPGTVNLLSITPQLVAAPDPHGPVINGKDIFKEQLEQALAPFGITVFWIDDWNLYHRLAGEVHCGTNAARSIPAVKWWESGR